MPFGDHITPEIVQRYREAGYWPTVSNIDYLDRNARLYPDKEALIDRHVRLTFRQFADASKRMALAFHERGLRKGDMVVAQIPNSVNFMVILYGMRRIGVIPLFLTMDLRAHEVGYAIQRSEAAAVIFTTGNPRFDYLAMYHNEIEPQTPFVKQIFVLGDVKPEGTISIHELLADPIETRYAPEFLASLQPEIEHAWNLTSTSGTTAMPKFSLQKESTIFGAEIAKRAHLSPDDVTLVLAPLRGGGSNVYKYAYMFSAVTGIFQDRFDAEEALQLIEREKVTVVAAVPAQLIKMLDSPNFDKYDLSSLRLAYYAGAALPLEVAQQLRKRMGVEILGEYGAMDSGVIFAMGSIDDPQEVRYSTVGLPMPGIVARVVDDEGNILPPGQVGELQFGGPCVDRANGYFKDAELTARVFTPDGYYQTGDLGLIQSDGKIAIVGRKKDMIIRGGQNISPLEVEDLICAHPKVLDVAVVGMPDRVMGEKACAFVIPKSGQTITFEELIAFLRLQEIANYKLPERLEIIAEFPMSAGGQKIQKHILREWVSKKLHEEGKL